MLAEKYNVRADVWSATSYNELYREATRASGGTCCTRARRRECRTSRSASPDTRAPIVAASDYLKVLPDLIDRWLPRPLVSLGTDGFGRSESRAALRNHFEVDSRFVTVATLAALARDEQIDTKVVAAGDQGPRRSIPRRSNPATA